MIVQIMSNGKLVNKAFNVEKDKMNNRLVMLFSCGITSYVATKMALEENKKKWGLESRIIYTYVKNEPSDNLRFLEDVQKKLDHEILILSSEEFEGDIYKVQEKVRYIAGVAGAPCTTKLKWQVRKDFVSDSDIQVFGFNAGEEDRLDKFANGNNDINISTPLICNRLTKEDCISIAVSDGLDIPISYKKGYQNANCIGCVKGGAGYWNKIKVDYPEVFWKQSKLERKFNAAINQRSTLWNEKSEGVVFRNLYEEFHHNNKKEGFTDFDKYYRSKKLEFYGTNKRIRLRVFLDRLTLDHGRKVKPIECGVLCQLEQGLT